MSLLTWRSLLTFAPASRIELPLGFEVCVSVIADWAFVVVAFSFFFFLFFGNGKDTRGRPVLTSNVTTNEKL